MNFRKPKGGEIFQQMPDRETVEKRPGCKSVSYNPVDTGSEAHIACSEDTVTSGQMGCANWQLHEDTLSPIDTDSSKFCAFNKCRLKSMLVAKAENITYLNGDQN